MPVSGFGGSLRPCGTSKYTPRDVPARRPRPGNGHVVTRLALLGGGDARLRDGSGSAGYLLGGRLVGGRPPRPRRRQHAVSAATTASAARYLSNFTCNPAASFFCLLCQLLQHRLANVLAHGAESLHRTHPTSACGQLSGACFRCGYFLPCRDSTGNQPGGSTTKKGRRRRRYKNPGDAHRTEEVRTATGLMRGTTTPRAVAGRAYRLRRRLGSPARRSTNGRLTLGDALLPTPDRHTVPTAPAYRPGGWRATVLNRAAFQGPAPCALTWSRVGDEGPASSRFPAPHDDAPTPPCTFTVARPARHVNL